MLSLQRTAMLLSYVVFLFKQNRGIYYQCGIEI